MLKIYPAHGNKKPMIIGNDLVTQDLPYSCCTVSLEISLQFPRLDPKMLLGGASQNVGAIKKII